MLKQKFIMRTTISFIMMFVLVFCAIMPMKVNAALAIKTSDSSTRYYYKIVNERTKLELHMAADNRACVWYDSGDSNQWYIVYGGFSYEYGAPVYKIINRRTNLELHMAADNRVGGWNNAGNSNLWKFEELQYSTVFRLRNVRTSLELHNAADNNVVGWNGAGDSNVWTFYRVY
ncbi:MAG: RICIN domain-containing protein [Clostridia bacterium]|nr:RICIN domain-containing protein [Clostridia bacterium]